MSKVHDLTIKDFLCAGADNVRINFHFCGDLQTAYDKLKPYTSLGAIEEDCVDGTVWLQIIKENIKITAFL